MNKPAVTIGLLLFLSLNAYSNISGSPRLFQTSSCNIDIAFIDEPTPAEIAADLEKNNGLVNVCSTANSLGTAACEVATYINRYYVAKDYKVEILSTGQSAGKEPPDKSLFNLNAKMEIQASFCQSLMVTKPGT